MIIRKTERLEDKIEHFQKAGRKTYRYKVTTWWFICLPVLRAKEIIGAVK